MNSNFQPADSEYIKRLSKLSHSAKPKDHETAHRDFFQHPIEGKIFLERLNRLIVNQLIWSGFLAPSIHKKDWDAITNSEPFHHAWEQVYEEVFSLEKFIKGMRKYRPDDYKTSPWVFFIIHIEMFTLRNWARVYREKPHYLMTPDKHIESRSDESISHSQSQDQNEQFFPALSSLIDSLSAKRQAVLLLWIWPQELPNEWRDKFLPNIFAVATQNGLTEEEVNDRLRKVSADNGPLVEMTVSELLLDLNEQYELQCLFDRKKQTLIKRFTRSSPQEDSQYANKIIESLKRVCYLAVEKNSQDDVKVASPVLNDDSSSESPDRKFARYCSKQKIHRKKWLKLLHKLNHTKSSGLMTTDQIAYVLNVEKDKCYVLKSRALASLGKAFKNMKDSSLLNHTEKEHQTEEQLEQILAEHICGSLKIEKN